MDCAKLGCVCGKPGTCVFIRSVAGKGLAMLVELGGTPAANVCADDSLHLHEVCYLPVPKQLP